MTTNYDEGKAKIHDLYKEYGNNAESLSTANEAKTRLLLIDTVLQALGWSKENFNPEQSCPQGGFTDYLIADDEREYFIVEAKRVGTTFKGNRRCNRSKYSLGKIRTFFASASGDAIKQAQNYCREKEVRYAVITNGVDWIVFQAIAPVNQKINDLQCLYFSSEGFLSEDGSFKEFWSLLSKDNVQSGSLDERFSELNLNEFDYVKRPDNLFFKGKLIEFINHGGSEEREHIWNFYDAFFDQIVDPKRKRMLQSCFVSNSKLDQFEKTIKRSLRDEPPKYIDAIRSISPGDSSDFIGKSEDRTGRVLIVVGSVGAGKSTFVRKILDSINTSSDLQNQTKAIILDLINEQAGDPSKFSESLHQKLFEEWKNQAHELREPELMKKIYARELTEDKGYFTSEEEYAKATLDKLRRYKDSQEKFLFPSMKYFLQKQYHRIIIFVDNIDQASEEKQKLAYSFCHTVASGSGAMVVLSMRESTYFKGKKAGFLDIRESDKIYHLESPDLIQVLSKRITYIEKCLDTGSDQVSDFRKFEWKNNDDTKLKYQQYSSVLKRTFLQAEQGKTKIQLLSVMAWHNTRDFFKYLRDLHYCLSSQTPWSLAEFTSSLIIVISTSKSEVDIPSLTTLYVPPEPKYRCSFLKIRILLMLHYLGSGRDSMSLARILKLSSLYEYTSKWTRKAIVDLVKARFIECLEEPTEESHTKNYILKDEHSFRLSPLGSVMLTEIQYDYTYLSLLGHYLPFHSREFFDDFLKETKDLHELMVAENFKLDRESLEFIAVYGGGIVTARYLCHVFSEEQPRKDVLKHFSEIGLIEEELSGIIAKFLKISGSKHHVFNQNKNEDDKTIIRNTSCFAGQLTIPGIGSTLDSDPQDIRIPKDIDSLKIETSHLAPKIFLAMVIRKIIQNQDYSTGSEIAKVINNYRLDSSGDVQASNVSKALRGKVLKNQPWLDIKKSNKKSAGDLFSLKDNWKIHYRMIFDSEPEAL